MIERYETPWSLKWQVLTGYYAFVNGQWCLVRNKNHTIPLKVFDANMAEPYVQQSDERYKKNYESATTLESWW